MQGQYESYSESKDKMLVFVKMDRAERDLLKLYVETLCDGPKYGESFKDDLREDISRLLLRGDISFGEDK